MRIVHVIAGIAAEHGGPTQVLRALTAELARRGHAQTVLTTDSRGAGRRLEAAAPERGAFAEGVALEVHRALIARSPHPCPGHALAAWRAGHAFDLAHVHGVFAAPPSLAMAAFRARGLPYVLRPCGMLDAFSLTQRPRLKRVWLSALDRANLRGAARVQASTEYEAEALRALLPPAQRARVVVLPQGVAAPGPDTGARAHPRPYVLFLSRIARKKGLLALVDAFARLAPRHPALDLVIAGPDEGGHRAEVEAWAQTLGLGRRVVFTGAVAGPMKSALYAGCEVFALPSEDENFGVVVVEAAHLGAPIVVSDRVGLAPEVARRGAGLVSARTPAALAEALEGALAAGRARFAAGLAGLAAAYAWPALADRVEALYREIVRERAASTR